MSKENNMSKQLIEKTLIESGIGESMAIVAAGEIWHTLIENYNQTVEAMQGDCKHKWEPAGFAGNTWDDKQQKYYDKCKRCGKTTRTDRKAPEIVYV